MSTAQVIYEQYKILPKRIKEELKSLIISENDQPLSLMQEIEEGLKEVKLMREGKVPTRTFSDLKRSLSDGK